ncbi:hypothetical protein B0T10DRAFT_529280 [Thelonectria olida]|uniref:Uncharacterized protein n=1 Tax=Thelonectria olida TaxID=1576542 RepID=A0A9P8W733_9HYPO|nr:hypothetical protein B0T10DRAFT_529280 [Thelonectria olida]
MQFMSQAMGWADHIILAMAPLGIITAMVGAIRCGGPSWLKAIIGRARESRAIPEAELMSSTSGEVCELWNGHEIVRVMGKGPIREFIILLPAEIEKGIEQNPEFNGSPVPMREPDSIQEVKIMELGQKTEDYDPEEPDHNNGHAVIIIRNKTVETPNLTLNVHTRFDRREHYIAAISGIVVQLIVLIYFGFATYYPSLMFLKDGRRIADYAFPCTAAGTLFLAAGVIICSHVVEESTEETRYQPCEGREARLVWVQRSGTVNDQAFNSFAIFPTSPRGLVTTSKRLDLMNPTKAVIATAVCLGGFIVQFVGLRGMHWSASVAQLGATIAMSIFRAYVRRSLAQVPESRRLVSGFELDWLAALVGKIWREVCKRRRTLQALGTKQLGLENNGDSRFRRLRRPCNPS